MGPGSKRISTLWRSGLVDNPSKLIEYKHLTGAKPESNRRYRQRSKLSARRKTFFASFCSFSTCLGGQFSTDSMAWVQIESQIVEILSWTHFSCWVQVREQHGSFIYFTRHDSPRKACLGVASSAAKTPRAHAYAVDFSAASAARPIYITHTS